MTDQGIMEGCVERAKGKSVRIVPQTGDFDTTAVIRFVTTVGKEGLTTAGKSRANLVLVTFQGSDVLLTSPFVRMVFFPDFPLYELDWPELPPFEPSINLAHLSLNVGQIEAIEKCLSNEEDDRLVVVIVSSITRLLLLFSRRVSGTSGYRQDYRDRGCNSQQDRSRRIKYYLGYCTVECRGQERCGEISRVRFQGFQNPCIRGLPLRMVSFPEYTTAFLFVNPNRMTPKA